MENTRASNSGAFPVTFFGHAVNQGRAGVLSLYTTHQNAA